MAVYRHVQKELIDQWLRVGWSLKESFDAYLSRSLVERVLLHEKLSDYMEDVYGTPETPGK